MTPRSLFVIILKILGLFLLKEIFFVFFNLVGYVTVSIAEYAGELHNTTLIVGDIVGLVIYCILFFLLVFKPELIIDRMNLDQGFYEEQFAMNMDTLVMVRIGVIVTGALLLVETLPDAVNGMVSYYRTGMGNGYVRNESVKSNGMLYYGAKLVIGYILLSNSSPVASFIAGNKQQKEVAGDDNDRTAA